MSTRSNIGILYLDGSVRMIYCHWDGYPDYMVPVLTKCYNTLEKVSELLLLGDLSSLRERVAPSVGESHTYDKPVDDITIAYHRDRGEAIHAARFFDNKEKAKAKMEEYLYLFNQKTGKWIYSEGGNFKAVPVEYVYKQSPVVSVGPDHNVKKLISKRDKLRVNLAKVEAELSTLGVS